MRTNKIALINKTIFMIKKYSEKMSLYIFLALLVYAPLHVLISTWIGTGIGLLEITKGFKEFLLVFGLLLTLLTVSKKTIFKLATDKLVWLIGLYAAITLLMAIIKPTDQDAEIIAVVYNLRFLLFFIYGALLVQKQGNTLIHKSAKIVLSVGVIVAMFGVFQVAVLPDDALAHIGYSKSNGTPAVFYISDETKDIERAYSTIKDPNSLGSYLIIILSTGLLYMLSRWPKDKYLLGGFILISVMCLFLTYSRSAWIGAIVAVLALTLFLPRTRSLLNANKKKITFSGLVMAILIIVGLFSFRNTSIVQNLIFHVGDDASVTSNSGRTQAIGYATEKISDNPVGYGPGTAGPASFKNDTQGAVITENYYLQIAYEVGIQGLIVFFAICLVLFRRLYKLRNTEIVSVALLASLCGLVITNLLVHIWFNEAVAYTWWGIAGLVVYHGFTITNESKIAKSTVKRSRQE